MGKFFVKNCQFSWATSTQGRGLRFASVGILVGCGACSSGQRQRSEALEKNLPSTELSYLEKKLIPKTAKSPAPPPSPSPAAPQTARAVRRLAIDPRDLRVDLMKVSQNLGVPAGRIADQARILAGFLESGHTPKSLCVDDESGVHEHLCDMMEAYRTVKKKTSGSTYSQLRVPIRPQHFRRQQAFGYGRLLNSIAREPAERVMVWAPRLLAQTSCPRNLSAVALRKLESLLPNARAQYLMEKLYAHASACLQPDDEGFETTHFRQALLRKMWGNHTGARFSINRAVLANESSEKSRVLYWAGSFQENPQKRRHYWDQLVKDYPLSYHALEVWKEEKQDPLFLFASRPDIQLNSKTQNPDEDVSTAISWVEALHYVRRDQATLKLGNWLIRNFKDQLTPSNKLYLSMLTAQNGASGDSISLMTRQVASNPEILNEQTLKLLFPRPYFEVFDRAATRTDTNLVLAVARQESGFNPRARSPANARGLLQLLPSTARMLTRDRYFNLYDEETNAQLGVKFLSSLIEKFGSVELALLGYNAGPGRVGEWKNRFPKAQPMLFLDLVPFKETRNYVSSILRNNYWYERLYREESRTSRRPLREQRSLLVSQLIKNHLAPLDSKNSDSKSQTF